VGGISITHIGGVISRTLAIFRQTIAPPMRMVYYYEAQKLPGLLAKYAPKWNHLSRAGEMNSSPGILLGPTHQSYH
jgi:hypothetical protein